MGPITTMDMPQRVRRDVMRGRSSSSAVATRVAPTVENGDTSTIAEQTARAQMSAQPAICPEATNGGASGPIDGALGLRDTEEVSHADQQHHDADREASHHVLERHPGQPNSDAARGGEHQDANIHSAKGRDGEDRYEEDERGQLHSHSAAIPSRVGMSRRRPRAGRRRSRTVRRPSTTRRSPPRFLRRRRAASSRSAG